jgi:RNA polymerase sigma factor (sigma-70 family)
VLREYGIGNARVLGVRHERRINRSPISMTAEHTAEQINPRVEAGIPFVEALARRVAATMPHSIDLGDLVQDGVIGLIDAAKRFEESRGIKFETFAERRVRGAMIDASEGARGVRRVRRSSRRRASAWLARSRAVARRPGRRCRVRRRAPLQGDRAHQHDRAHHAALVRRQHRRIAAAPMVPEVQPTATRTCRH